MSDEQPQAVTEPEVPAAEPQAEPEPHPLDPGGKRFGEIYGRLKDSERDNQALRERLANLEGRIQAAPQQQQAQQQWYKPEQLQAMVDQGKITPALMSAQLAWQAKEEAKREMAAEYRQTSTRTAAQTEVAQYLERVPGLRNSSSDDFYRVARAAREIAEELGRTVEDPVVQRRALRETFGTLDRLATQQKTREFARQNADTHSETQRGAGSGEAPSRDPFADIPSIYRDHWKRLGYTPERMKAEADQIRKRVATGEGRYRWNR